MFANPSEVLLDEIIIGPRGSWEPPTELLEPGIRAEAANLLDPTLPEAFGSPVLPQRCEVALSYVRGSSGDGQDRVALRLTPTPTHAGDFHTQTQK